MTEPFDRAAARKKLEALRKAPAADVPVFSTKVHEAKPGDFSNMLPHGVPAKAWAEHVKERCIGDGKIGRTPAPWEPAPAPAEHDQIAESFFRELAKVMGWTLEHARQSQAARVFLPIVQTIVAQRAAAMVLAQRMFEGGPLVQRAINEERPRYNSQAYQEAVAGMLDTSRTNALIAEAKVSDGGSTLTWDRCLNAEEIKLVEAYGRTCPYQTTMRFEVEVPDVCA